MQADGGVRAGLCRSVAHSPGRNDRVTVCCGVRVTAGSLHRCLPAGAGVDDPDESRELAFGVSGRHEIEDGSAHVAFVIRRGIAAKIVEVRHRDGCGRCAAHACGVWIDGRPVIAGDELAECAQDLRV